MIRGLLKFGVKAGLAYSAIYYTVDQGVWDTSDNTAQVYGKIYKTVSPYISDSVKDIHVDVPDIPVPKIGDMSLTLKNTWNRGVMATFRFLDNLPETTCNYTSLAYEKISDLLNETGTPPSEPAK